VKKFFEVITSKAGEPFVTLKKMFRPLDWLRSFFESPAKVAAACLFFLFCVLVSDGTLLRLWSLHTVDRQIDRELAELQTGIKKLHEKIKLANSPSYVEKQARDHFDLVEEGEILFLFTE
jgi:cell division protein FtsB